MRTIAEAVHADVAAIYYHFHSKAGLLAAILAPYLDHQRRTIEAARAVPDADRARAVLTGYLDARVMHPEAAAIALDPGVRSDAALSAPINETEAAVAAALANCLTGRDRQQRAELALTVTRHGSAAPANRERTLSLALAALG